jgi:hypothetical protein
VTQDAEFARHVGEHLPIMLAGSPTAATLRSLGSPEPHFSQLHISGKRFSTAIQWEALERHGVASRWFRISAV